MNERPHVDYFDGLRIFAALCVIFMHTAAGPLRAGINTGWHLLNVCTSLAFTAVPLFFMMSGYLLMTSRKTADISVLLRHRLPRLVVSLAVISVGTWVLTVRTGEFNQNFQNQSSGFEIVLAACIFLLCKQTCNRPPRAWVKAVTEPVVALSMAIYLMHNIFLSMLYSAGVSVRSFGSTVGVTLLVFAACFVVTKTVATVRPLCYLATGKTYAEACRSCNWAATFRRLRGHSTEKK